MHHKRDMGMKRAALFQFASKYSSIAVQLVITAILSRLVSPEEFGLISIVTVFTAFFQLFSDMGLGTAVVQFQDLTEEDMGGLFCFSMLVSLVLSFLFAFASVPIASFYGDSRLVPLCLASIPSLAFSTLNMVPNGLMLRNRRFDLIGVRLVVTTFFSGAVAIAMAMFGFGAYSLVVQTDIMTGLVFLWNYASQPLRGINRHFVYPLKRVFSYSAYQFGFSAVNYFSRNLDKLLIGRFLGTAAAGYYDKAYKLTTYPLSSFAGIIGSIIQPFMAEHQDEPDAIFHCWMRVSKVLSLIGIPIAALFFSASFEIVNLFYGPGWDEAIPVFSALSISVYFQIICNPSGGFFQSLGRTDLMFHCSIVNTVLTLAGLFLGLMGGSLLSVAWGIAVAFCIQFIPLVYFLIIRGFKESPSCLSPFLLDFAIGILSCCFCSAFSSFFPFSGLSMFLLKSVAIGSFITACYAVTGRLSMLKTVVLH